MAHDRFKLRDVVNSIAPRGMRFCLKAISYFDACLNFSEAGVFDLQYTANDCATCSTYHTCWSQVCEVETIAD